MRSTKHDSKLPPFINNCIEFIKEKAPKSIDSIYHRYLSQKRHYTKYRTAVTDSISESIILIILTVIATIIFLFLIKMSWGLYCSTPVGQQFIEMNQAFADSITRMLDRNTFRFSLELVLSAYVICLAASSVSQFFHVARHFYHSRGFIGKFVFFGLPFTGLVGLYIKNKYGLEPFQLSIFAASLPTFCVFWGCFNISKKLLPEIGDLVIIVLKIKNELVIKKLPDLKLLIKELIDKINNS